MVLTVTVWNRVLHGALARRLRAALASRLRGGLCCRQSSVQLCLGLLLQPRLLRLVGLPLLLQLGDLRLFARQRLLVLRQLLGDGLAGGLRLVGGGLLFLELSRSARSPRSPGFAALV